MSVSPNPEPAPAAGLFPATGWTLVARAVNGADGAQQAALNELLQRYWRPIYIYLRRSGKPEAVAEDLTQGFFAHVLEKNLLERVHLRHVRFRGYLRGVLEHYLANESRRNGAQKRKGAVSLDIAGAESWLATAPTDSAESAFDRFWAALKVLNGGGAQRSEFPLRFPGRATRARSRRCVSRPPARCWPAAATTAA